MSTRAVIVIKDCSGDKLLFYRHCDGYPEGTMPTLKTLIRWVKEGKIRDNVGQAAGWLIILGHREYKGRGTPCIKDEWGGNMWKVGAYEPATEVYGDIEYLYLLDLTKKTIKIKRM